MKHTTKKLLSLFLAAIMLTVACLSLVSCGAQDDGPCVYVSIADENGNLVVRYEKVPYTENMTVDMALSAIHEYKFSGGASGYASYESAYGLSMSKLWGVENGGSYGYYVNNAFPSSLAATIAEGDHVYAFIYTDTQTFTDTYAFFNANTVLLEKDASVTLTLSYSGYDESWMPVTLPVSGANIYVNGKISEHTTSENGKVTLSFDKKGTYILTADSNEMNLTPAFVVITVE